jgi:membrane protease YdiL (CAAX protease family)
VGLATHSGAWPGIVVSNLFQNGPFEEFLFRGVLLTAIMTLMRPGWALVTQALVFGLWHAGLGFAVTGGDMIAGVGSVLVIQASLGLAFGYLFTQTGNLAIPSLVHVLMNSAT